MQIGEIIKHEKKNISRRHDHSVASIDHVCSYVYLLSTKTQSAKRPHSQVVPQQITQNTASVT